MNSESLIKQKDMEEIKNAALIVMEMIRLGFKPKEAKKK